jgi:hypothetical protein
MTRENTSPSKEFLECRCEGGATKVVTSLSYDGGYPTS